MANKGICTYADLLTRFPQLYTIGDSNLGLADGWVISPLELKEIIVNSDSQLLSQLAPYYNYDLSTSPYISNPIPFRHNQGDGALFLKNGADVLSFDDTLLTFSQVLKLTFTSATAFKVTSLELGVLGTGDKSTNFTSTNGEITIPASLWDGTPQQDDVFFIKVYNYPKSMVYLSSLRATIEALNSIYTEQAPNASGTAAQYQKIYDQRIADIQSGKARIETGQSDRNIDPIEIDYNINEYGEDMTDYPLDSDDIY